MVNFLIYWGSIFETKDLFNEDDSVIPYVSEIFQNLKITFIY